jgi:uncharacterized membrane protein
VRSLQRQFIERMAQLVQRPQSMNTETRESARDPQSMPGPESEPGELSTTAKDNLDLLMRLDRREDAAISGLQLWIERISGFFGSPAYFVFAVVFIASWVAVNAWGFHLGWRHVDEPPFPWLQGFVSSNALLLTVAVLIRQSRMEKIAEHRAHLDLQINMLTEQKVTKTLQLVDGLRRELTRMRPRIDEEVSDLTKPADAHAILNAIKTTKQTR